MRATAKTALAVKGISRVQAYEQCWECGMVYKKGHMKWKRLEGLVLSPLTIRGRVAQEPDGEYVVRLCLNCPRESTSRSTSRVWTSAGWKDADEGN